MKLITVEAHFPDNKIDVAIAAFKDQSEKVKTMDGCDSYGLYRSGSAVVILQKWRDMDCFDAYRQSETFSGLGTSLKPLMSQPPVTTVASIDIV